MCDCYRNPVRQISLEIVGQPAVIFRSAGPELTPEETPSVELRLVLASSITFQATSNVLCTGSHAKHIVGGKPCCW